MRKLLLFSAVLILFAGCSSKKQITQQLQQGNYDLAIHNALELLQSKKTAKRKSKFVGILKQGFDRITKRDLDDIAFLQKDNNPANDVTIYEMYVTLDARQRAIEPVLPLYIDGREVSFSFNDYTSQIIEYKNKAVEYLYYDALSLLESNNKLDIRQAHEQLQYLNAISPDYKDVQTFIEIAYNNGLDYVLVTIKNGTQQIIPDRLEEELLNFDTYGLNNFWTVYHGQAHSDVTYDFSMDLNLLQINISPELINNRERLRKKEIIDGWEYLLDENGNVLKDSLGNDIKVDKKVIVKARLFEIEQTKSAQVIGKVLYKDLINGNISDTFPIQGQFQFNNLYARFRGDKRALTKQDRILLRNRPLPFPSNEELVYLTSEELKLKLKSIILNSYAL